VASSQAASQNLALLRKSNGINIIYVLYDPAKLAVGIGDSETPGVIYGYLDVMPHHGDSWNAGEIKYSAAEKGYGPLMYELAMSDFPTGLMPDRFSTSPAARKVWQKYAARSDIEKKPFDDVKKPKTKPKVDDAKLIPDWFDNDANDDISYLNAAYVGSGDGASKPTLIANHKDAAATLADELQTNVAAIESKIMHMGDDYFGNRYRDG